MSEGKLFICFGVKTETQKIVICNAKLVNGSLLARVSDRLLTVAITWLREHFRILIFTILKKYHSLTVDEYIYYTYTNKTHYPPSAKYFYPYQIVPTTQESNKWKRLKPPPIHVTAQ